MNAIAKKDAEWRVKGAERFYTAIMSDIKNLPRCKKPFIIKDIFSSVESVSHLSDSYAYDMIMAVLIEAARRGEIERIGRSYRLKQ